MEEFYKFLRQIQKKERDKSTLARVEENFYEEIHKYLDKLRESTLNDPFAEENTPLKESRMIATEICERREHKITDAAVINIHRSYHLFTGKPKFDLLDTTPINLTPEEEKFYFSLIDTLKNHRVNISLDKLNKEDFEENNEKLDFGQIEKPEDKLAKPVEEDLNDEILEKLESVGKAKVIKEEKREPIEKQIFNSKDEEFPDIPIDDEFQYESKNKKSLNTNETILIFDEIDSIIGVDEKIYGPFRAQDIIVIPNENAEILTKNRKARIVKI